MTAPDALTVLRELEIRGSEILAAVFIEHGSVAASAVRSLQLEICSTIARLEREQAEAPIVYCRRCGKEDPLGHD